MSIQSSAIHARVKALPPGVLWGSLGVLAFSFSLPATRLAVRHLDPLFVGVGRAVVAGALAAVTLRRARAPRPTRAQVQRLAVVAVGVVFGFPVCTALALHRVPAAHGAVVIGVLPAATAVLGVRRGHERPGRMFWVAVAVGAAIVTAFAARHGLGALTGADALLVSAVVLAAFGYAEGGLLAREMPGAHVICWALLLALPGTTLVTVATVAAHGLHGPASSWLGFAYLSTVSMFFGFFAWYRGLAEGGIAGISQLQLVQPALSLLWATLLLGERFEPLAMLTVVAVIGCIAVALRSRRSAVRG